MEQLPQVVCCRQKQGNTYGLVLQRNELSFHRATAWEKRDAEPEVKISGMDSNPVHQVFQGRRARSSHMIRCYGSHEGLFAAAEAHWILRLRGGLRLSTGWAVVASGGRHKVVLTLEKGKVWSKGAAEAFTVIVKHMALFLSRRWQAARRFCSDLALCWHTKCLNWTSIRFFLIMQLYLKGAGTLLSSNISTIDADDSAVWK